MSKPGDRASKVICLQGAGAFNVVVGHGASPKNGRGESAPPGVQGVRRAQKSFDRKLGDLEGASPLVVGGRQSRERYKRHAVTVAFEKSDEAVVPAKSAKMRVTPFESMEERAEAKGSSAARNALSTLSELRAPTDMQWIRQRGTQKSTCARVDIQSFHTIDHGWMQQFSEHQMTTDWLFTRHTQGGSPVREIRSPGLCPGGGSKGPSLPGRRVKEHLVIHRSPRNSPPYIC
jgi:hypothetical protein